MVKKRVMMISVALAAVLLVIFYPTEKRKIGRLLKKTAAWATRDEGESVLMLAARSKKAGNYFTENVDFAYEKRDLKRELSLEEIEKGYIFLMQQKTSFKVRMEDVEIELSGDDAATATATVLVESQGAPSADISNVNEVEFGLKKQEPGWRICGMKIIEVLEK